MTAHAHHPAACSLLFLLLAPALVAQEAPRLTFQQRLNLIEKYEPRSGEASTPNRLEEDLKRKLTPEERRAFERTDEGRWKVFEDDLIRFELPDDPMLTVEVADAKAQKPIRVVGNVSTSADNHFDRAYHLKVGKDLPYGVILLSESPWFDNGLCDCGAIAYKKCLMEEGTALEFSLLHTGNLKKVQALGEKHRAVLFEWTHSAIPQSAYARLGHSLRLKQSSPRTLAQWHAEARKQEDERALLSWLERGDDEKKVVALLGQPADRSKIGHWTYLRDVWQTDGSGQRFTMVIRMDPKSRYLGMARDGASWGELPPRKGTVAWADKRVEDADDFRTSEKEKAHIKKEDLPEVVRLFLEHAPTAQGKDWERWSSVAGQMTRKGWRDPRIPEAVLKRYAERNLDHFYSTEILDAYKVEDRQKLFLAQMHHILDLKKESAEAAGDARSLLPALDYDDPASLDCVRRTLKHPNPEVRQTAYHYADRLPAEEAIATLKPALEEDNIYVRANAAKSLRPLVHAQDLPWLEARHKLETDDYVKDPLAKTIEAARSRPGKR